jgi:hypothetical protein
MDGGWLGRLRWRRRGAWMWPAFIGAVALDAVLGHALPPAGDSESLAAAGIAALVLNVIAVILLTRPTGALVRRVRGELPPVVARNYGGTLAVALVTGAVLLLGVLHHSALRANQAAMRDAVTRAEAWIGADAPAQFRHHLTSASVFAIQPGRIFRTCVPDDSGRRVICVIVDTHQPFPGGVKLDGYEPNWLFSEGVG